MLWGSRAKQRIKIKHDGWRDQQKKEQRKRKSDATTEKEIGEHRNIKEKAEHDWLRIKINKSSL